MPRCPACLSSEDDPVERRDRVPLLQNAVVPTREAALAFPTGRLDMRACRRCGFVWNAAFEPARIAYDSTYDNSVQASAVYRAHQEAMVRRLLDVPGPLHVLEVGCGAGEFLAMLDASGRLASAIGYDPAWIGQRSFGPHITVRAEPFTPASAAAVPPQINVVCSRHTIEHIAAPRGFVSAMAELAVQRDIRLFLETPDVTWILENAAFEDLFYEHCSLFAPGAMRRLLAAFGLAATCSPVYGGQYMWVEATRGRAEPEAAPDPGLVSRFRARAAAERTAWQERVRVLGRRGPVAIWGAASKGVTFALLTQGLAMAIDLNRAKQGAFLPVTALPIVSPQAARDAGVVAVVVMNPNYETEIAADMQRMTWPAELISLRRPPRSMADDAARTPRP
ncbi:class I SAM-dependent methyltransferase [Aquibium sp. A9E412]|uniref:class I SAM-dependent methyltransferase n=1 Tax=Aquibium sp. A9E412 TaxID=2976767 RepID=UPI0025B03A24|nr:class I SAM-dependent methyltransferase [Aquibium sp. A9E412]MDN2566905.1 class I SAM-dependent methyltransferase [Aquibium sp. A9E412]